MSGVQMMKGFFNFITVSLLIIFVYQPLFADTVTISTGKDNTIYEELPENSNGMGEFLFAGKNNRGFAARSLIKFDLAGKIPDGAIITSVELTLGLARTSSGIEYVSLHRLFADWGQDTSDGDGSESLGAPASEFDATWLWRFNNSDAWSNPGGDYANAPSATILIDQIDTYTSGSTAGMVADVQNWLNNPSENYGWILIGQEQSLHTRKKFYSFQSEIDMPQLTVQYVPEPVTAVLLAFGGFIVKRNFR